MTCFWQNVEVYLSNFQREGEKIVKMLDKKLFQNTQMSYQKSKENAWWGWEARNNKKAWNWRCEWQRIVFALGHLPVHTNLAPVSTHVENVFRAGGRDQKVGNIKYNYITEE